MTAETPGTQVPAAVLPQSDYEQVPVPQPYLPAPVKQRNRPAIVLTVFAVVFLAGMITFATLWLVEKDDHRGTNGELVTVQANLTDVTKDLEHTKELHLTADAEKLRLERNLMRIAQCADAARQFVSADSKAAADNQLTIMLGTC